MMLQLGRYQFSMDTAAYQRLRRSTRWRWTAVDRQGRRPARHFDGPGEDRIELDGVILPTYKGGLGQVEAMRTEAGGGVPLVLVDGEGHVLGRWVIETVEETQQHLLRSGAPRRVEFRLQISHYGDDQVAA